MVEAGLLIFSLLCAGALCLALFRFGSASERGRQLERELALLREQLEAERLRAQESARQPEVLGGQAAAGDGGASAEGATPAAGASVEGAAGGSVAAAADASAASELDLNALAWGMEDYFNRSAHPKELLGHENFEKGVSLLAGESYATAEVMNYARGSSIVLSCMAFEALARRAGTQKDEGVASQVVASVTGLYHWPRYFALRALDANAEGPVVARLLATLGPDWVEFYPLSMLREFVARRVSAGEQVTADELVAEIGRIGFNEEHLDGQTRIAEELAGTLPASLAVDFKRWRAERVDVEFLKSFGRVWEEGEGAGEDGGAQPEAVTRRVAELEAALRRDPPRSSMLVGESGVGKTELVRSLARRLQKDGWTVFEASAADVLSGQQYIGQLEGRVQMLVRQIGGRRVLWVVPNFHETLWAGRHQYSPVGLLDLLLPHVEAGALRLVGEVPAGAYEKLLRLRPKLRTAMHTCHVPPLGDAETLELGRRWAARHALTDGGEGRTPSSSPSPRIGEETLREAFQLAKQFLGEKAAPGNLLFFLEATHRRLLAEEVDEGAALSNVITLDDLLVTLSQLTGLPVSILDEREGLNLEELRAFFGQRVLGQPEAVDCLVERVAMVKAGLTDPTRPQGVFLFVGPTGTGKTEIAKTLAEFLFGSPERMIRLDMSEFQSPESLDRILGESSETSESAALVNAIRRQPFSVVLLDEFEKAHPQVWDLFLQVFDDGRLTDRRGNTADFRHCVVIMTSNLGATLPAGAGIGFSQEQAEFAAGSVERAVSKAFRREFVNRLDRVVVFRPLGLGVMRDLLRKELNDVLHRRGLRTRQWAVEWDESAIEFLLRKGFTADLGARPLKRAVERYLLSPLAMTIVNHQFPEGDQFLFVRSAEDGASIEVQFVDPDAPEDGETTAPEPAEEFEEEEEGREPRLESITLDARGTAEEIRFLQQRFHELSSEVESDEWRRRKAAALAETQAEGFWNSPGRFSVLGLAEYMDRIEAGLVTAGSLLSRLGRTGGRGPMRLPQELVGRLAEQIYLLEAASRGLAAGEPRDAFLLVEASREAGTDAESSDRFARRITTMYRRWAEKRRMRLKVLEERDGHDADEAEGNSSEPPRYRALVAVSGYGAHTILSPEAGLHVLETPQDEKSFNRAKVLVRVAGQPDEPAGHAPGALLKQAESAFEAEEQNEPSVVRSYREEPSPLVRDRRRGWRTGKLERVLGGDFDLIT